MAGCKVHASVYTYAHGNVVCVVFQHLLACRCELPLVLPLWAGALCVVIVARVWLESRVHGY